MNLASNQKHPVKNVEERKTLNSSQNLETFSKLLVTQTHELFPS